MENYILVNRSARKNILRPRLVGYKVGLVLIAVLLDNFLLLDVEAVVEILVRDLEAIFRS